MTTYNTQNPVPSVDVRDLYDNAQNLDSLVSGPLPAYADRLGVSRKSYKGMEQDFDALISGFEGGFYSFLLDSGFESTILPYVDGSPLTVARPTQLIQRASTPNVLYSVKVPSTFPLTLSGNFSTDSPLLAIRTDRGTRTDLRNYGAVADGIVNDSLAFSSFESVISGEPVDLIGKSYAVTVIPSKNAYYNGTWVVAGNRRPAILGRTFLDPSPKMRSIGGQLGDLRRALGDPFQQYTGIVFIGDSITWGTGATGANDPNPRDGTLSDPRDFFATASFVNEFKRYIGSRYAPLATPILSNHPASPSGQSTAEYQREVIMYPRYGEINLTQASGASMSITEVVNTVLIGGGQLRLASANLGVENSHAIDFTFTGNEFRVYFSCVAADATFYELLVDGVSQGVFSMKAGATATSGTVTDGQVGAYYEHSFPFVRNKVITVRTKRNGETGSRVARFNAIRILKRIVIKNQGINGSSARVYGPNNLSGSFGDGVAVEANDSFVFCQLGTNDRGIPGANQNPRGVNVFRRFLDGTLDYLAADVGVILMCSPPAVNESPATFWLNMTDIRDAIIREAESRSVDFIDNYSAFSGVDMNAVTSDGLHPNDLGYAIMARNIINSLESAP